MQIAQGSLQVAMSQQFFYRMQVSAIIYQVCGPALGGMANSMHCIIFTVKTDLGQ